MSRTESVSSTLETIHYDPSTEQLHRTRSWSMNVHVATSQSSVAPPTPAAEQQEQAGVPAHFQLHSAAVLMLCLSGLFLPTFVSFSHQMVLYSAHAQAQKACDTLMETLQASVLTQSQGILLWNILRDFNTDDKLNNSYVSLLSKQYHTLHKEIYALPHSLSFRKEVTDSLHSPVTKQCQYNLFEESRTGEQNASESIFTLDKIATADVERTRSCFEELSDNIDISIRKQLEGSSSITRQVLIATVAIHTCISTLKDLNDICLFKFENVSHFYVRRMQSRVNSCANLSSRAQFSWASALQNASKLLDLHMDKAYGASDWCLLSGNIQGHLKQLDRFYLKPLQQQSCRTGSSLAVMTTRSQTLLTVHLLVLLAVTTLSLAIFVQVFRTYLQSFREMNSFVKRVSRETRKMTAEQGQSDALLYQMLPRFAVEQLKKGQSVEAEHFDKVTVYFSDIVGFNDHALDTSPIEIVHLLNTLYGAFDEVVESYDVYKVETIGDAYMVASGLPERNGDRHASEIAAMALAMCTRAASYTLPGADRPLPLRVGINSGACVAGVIGLKNPRYCLFGDTVNTASRMESTGEAYRIHSSEAFKQAVELVGGFQFELRGTVQVKGKGSMTTYWLTGRAGNQSSL